MNKLEATDAELKTLGSELPKEGPEREKAFRDVGGILHFLLQLIIGVSLETYLHYCYFLFLCRCLMDSRRCYEKFVKVLTTTTSNRT